jgi:cyclophilin family peptidyl-prolyl cis-trans isomerase
MNKKDLLLYIFVILFVALVVFLANQGKNYKDNQRKIMIGTTSTVVLETSLGNIEIALFVDKAPETTANFIKLAKAGFYENTKFHRVIKDFMIQGGDPYTKGDDVSVYGTGGPGYTFKDEINDIPMVKGIVAMANSGPNTNGSQFFIITAAETPWLVGRHTVFGEVISGLDVVEKIEKVRTNGTPFDRPLEPVVINKINVR